MKKEEKVINDILEHISSLDAEEKSGFAHRIIFEVVNWSSMNYYEAMGLLEGVKIDYHETWSKIIQEENEEDRKKLN
ncbi:MAG: hypothetical protein H8E98_04085 [Bacteroidetes bacterium]|nr:hypothetical protein [Bacteroidota bacterium]